MVREAVCVKGRDILMGNRREVCFYCTVITAVL